MGVVVGVHFQFRARKHRPALLVRKPAPMVGMHVGQQHHVDLFRRHAGRGQIGLQEADGRADWAETGIDQCSARAVASQEAVGRRPPRRGPQIVPQQAHRIGFRDVLHGSQSVNPGSRHATR
jgi:hypothetical protein